MAREETTNPTKRQRVTIACDRCRTVRERCDGKRPTCGRLPPASSAQSVARLPSNWRRLVDIFFTYADCWLPILDKDEVLKAAAGIPSEGITLGPSTALPPSYAERWPTLALASFQDASTQAAPSPDIENHGSLSPKEFYSISRSMIPSEEKQFDLPLVQALLIHSVLMGQGAGLAAWMLVGTSVDIEEVDSVVGALPEGTDETWAPVTGLDNSFATAMVASPLKNFRQLYKLTQLSVKQLLRASGPKTNPV
ncbi:Quinic acid utilization activator-like protein [Tolypocladium paradoxum]|uniref:Quinic acid utilization activator-like protein n=1 Tax=Tolypocladium paradoxum TaxID=94208 RepID=A0A2S4KLJ4_9HYPO|nr:Quinic acid utilization activator-like protein [Tolypocladium paradoxum]